MKTIIVSPHPDDEVLGVGGTALRRKAEGHTLAWLIVTSIDEKNGWSAEKVSERHEEILEITKFFDFDKVYELNFPAATLDQVPTGKIVEAISAVFKSFAPDEVFMPFPEDVHSDHRIVSDVVISCSKWFRCPSIRRVYAYETLSETEFNFQSGRKFSPNSFINIASYLEGKVAGMALYKSEFGEFPFPRSFDSIKALAMVRGSNAGFKYAEAFELLYERD